MTQPSPAYTPIETHYQGHLFRSRLEARWAVFFDTLNIEWLYEPQGYSIAGRPYLPDFYLPASRTWVEVKGSDAALDVELLRAAVSPGGLPLGPDVDGRARWLALLGPIPSPQEASLSVFHWAVKPHQMAGTVLPGGDVVGETIDMGVLFQGGHLHSDWFRPSPPSVRPHVDSVGLAFCPLTYAAYKAARIARFEHGVRG